MNDVLLSPRNQRRLQVLLDIEAGACTVELAAQRLRCSERQVWRLLAASRRDGPAGLVHGNRGQVSARHLPA